jgi:transcriptional regulator with XRE-family HTH domain
MNRATGIEKLKNQSVKDDKWLNNAQWRQDNEAWLDLSFAIAVKILRTLREKSMTQKDLAELLGLSPQYINKIVKGSENLTIETITRIENALNIRLLQVPEIAFTQIYTMQPNITPKPLYQSAHAFKGTFSHADSPEWTPCKQPEKRAS